MDAEKVDEFISAMRCSKGDVYVARKICAKKSSVKTYQAITSQLQEDGILSRSGCPTELAQKLMIEKPVNTNKLRAIQKKTEQFNCTKKEVVLYLQKMEPTWVSSFELSRRFNTRTAIINFMCFEEHENIEMSFGGMLFRARSAP